MLNMGIPSRIVDQHIVKKYQAKFSEILFKDMIREALKSGWSISQHKKHD